MVEGITYPRVPRKRELKGDLTDFLTDEEYDEHVLKIKPKPELNMYEAFELMHKQDGTSKGHRFE